MGNEEEISPDLPPAMVLNRMKRNTGKIKRFGVHSSGSDSNRKIKSISTPTMKALKTLHLPKGSLTGILKKRNSFTVSNSTNEEDSERVNSQEIKVVPCFVKLTKLKTSTFDVNDSGNEPGEKVLNAKGGLPTPTPVQDEKTSQSTKSKVAIDVNDSGNEPGEKVLKAKGCLPTTTPVQDETTSQSTKSKVAIDVNDSGNEPGEKVLKAKGCLPTPTPVQQGKVSQQRKSNFAVDDDDSANDAGEKVLKAKGGLPKPTPVQQGKTSQQRKSNFAVDDDDSANEAGEKVLKAKGGLPKPTPVQQGKTSQQRKSNFADDDDDSGMLNYGDDFSLMHCAHHENLSTEVEDDSDQTDGDSTVFHLILEALVKVQQDTEQILKNQELFHLRLTALEKSKNGEEDANSIETPIENIEEFQKAEEKLQADKNARNQLVASLSLLGGNKLQDTVALMLRSLMSQELRLQFNAQKANNGKLVFKSTSLYKVVLDAIRKRPSSNKTSEKEILVAIGLLFTRTADEEGGRERRRETAAIKRAALEAYKLDNPDLFVAKKLKRDMEKEDNEEDETEDDAEDDEDA